MVSNTSSGESRAGAGWLWRVGRAIVEGFLFKGSHVMAIAAAVGVALLLVVNFVTVVGRKSPWAGAWLSGGYEVSELFMAMVTVLAVAYCWYVGGHIRIDIVRDRVSPRSRAVLDTVASLLFFIAIAVISWTTWRMAIASFATSERTWTFHLLTAPFKFIFSLVMAHFTLVLLRSCVGLFAKARGRHVEHEGLY